MPEITHMGSPRAPEQTQWTPSPLPSLQLTLRDGVSAIIKSEAEWDELVAYAHLLSLTRKWPTESLIQEQNPLYDQVFYMAKSIERNPDGTYVIVTEDAFVRLNDKIPAWDIPTVGELRNKTKEGILFSWVGALSIITRDGVRIPLLRRDAGAPTDAGKYTLPAGRADKSPGLTAYEECLEEIVIFARKNGELTVIVPYLENAWVNESKAKLLVQLARTRYLQKLVQSSEAISLSALEEIINAPLTPVTVRLWNGGNVKTIFDTGYDEKYNPQGIEESGIHAFHDTAVNTFEFIRSLSLDLTPYDDIHVVDGDGFGRESGLFTLEELHQFGENGEAVKSLEAALRLWAFSSWESTEASGSQK